MNAYTASKERSGLANAVFPLIVYRVDGASQTARALADELYEDGGGSAYREVMAKHGVPAQHIGAAYAFFDNLKSVAAAERIVMGLSIAATARRSSIEREWEHLTTHTTSNQSLTHICHVPKSDAAGTPS